MKLWSALGLALFIGVDSAAAPGFVLSGTVLDENGGGLAGVELSLVHEDSGFSRRAVSGSAGHFQFSAVPPGEYTLEASAAGFATSRFAGLRYFADTKPIFNLTLRLREVQESMTFTGEAPLINVSQSQVGLSIEERQLQELPLERRDYLELVGIEGSAHTVEEAPPGVRPVTATPQHTVSGANAIYTTYQLDGFANTRDQHGVVLVDADIEAIEEFRVLSGQFSAEYGRSVAGIVSATSTGGSSDYHGSVYGYLRPGGWDADDPLSGEQRALDRQEAGLTLSGPLGSERTQFYANVSHRNQHEDVVVTAPFEDGRFRGVFDLPSDHTRGLVKISHALSRHHQLTVQGVVSRRDALEGVGGLDIFDNASTTTNDDGAIFASVVSELGSVSSDFRFGLSFETFRASAGAPPGGRVQVHPTLGILGNETRLERVDEDHIELSETLSFTLRDHNLKTGFSFVRIASVAELERFDDGVDFYSPSDPATPIVRWQSMPPASAAPLERDETHVQLFVADDWQLSPYLTLNLGLRWERESSVPDNDNVAPRIGFHWDATRDGRTSVRGGYGVFYGFMFSIVDTLEKLYGPDGRGVIARAPGTPPSDEAPRNIYLDATSFATDERLSPRAQHVTLGLERDVGSGLSAAVDLSYIRGDDLVVPGDLNAPAFFDYTDGRTRDSIAADASRPFGVPGGPVPAGSTGLPGGYPFAGFRDLYLLTSSGSSRYWGVKLNVTKRYASDFMLQAVYHWSRTENDGDDYRVRQSLPIDPGRRELEWGRSAFDIPSSLTINGVWDAPFDIRVTGLLRARSGRPIDPRVDEDLDGDLKLRERAVVAGSILARNSFRVAPTATMDLSIAKLVELESGRNLTFALDVFNLANRLNPLQFLSTYGRGGTALSTFGQIVQAGPPRQFQLSMRFAF